MDIVPQEQLNDAVGLEALQRKIAEKCAQPQSEEEKLTEEKLAKFNQVRETILQHFDSAQRLLDQVHDVVRANLIGDDKCLTNHEQEYLSCIQLKRDELVAALTKDEAYWRQEQDRARQESTIMRQQLEALMKDCHQRLSAILARKDVIKIGHRTVLKKLPAWGHHAGAHEIDFEWPTVFEFMDPDVSLTSIKFKDQNGAAVTSVQCTLSNGQQSPVFEKPSQKHMNE